MSTICTMVVNVSVVNNAEGVGVSPEMYLVFTRHTHGLEFQFSVFIDR